MASIVDERANRDGAKPDGSVKIVRSPFVSVAGVPVETIDKLPSMQERVPIP